MEPFAGELVGRALAEAGVDVRIGITVTAVRRPGGTGPVIVTLEDGGEVEADEVLFATGRQPFTDDIGLDTVGLAPGSWLEVDDTCLVQPVDPAPWGPHAVTADYRAVPQVFFCDPPVGAVGLTADRAERAGHRIRVVDVDLGQAVPGPACTPTATPAAPAWSSTRTTTTCSASPSSAPAWKN